MPIPINIDAAHARRIGWGVITQDASEAPASAYALWYEFVGHPGELVISLLVTGGTTVPNARRYTVYESDGTTIYNGMNSEIENVMLPVVGGVSYLIKVFMASGVPTLPYIVDILPAPGTDGVTIPAGKLMINSDGPLLPAAFIDPDTGVVLGYRASVTGEGGEVLPDGHYLLTSDDTDQVARYDADFNEVSPRTSISPLGNLPTVSSDRVSIFYVNNPDSALQATIYRVLLDGTIDDTWTINTTLNGVMRGAAPSRDNTKLYWTAGDRKIHVWDLVNNLALSDLATIGIAGDSLLHDVLVMDDNAIIVAYRESATGFTKAVRYNPSGTLLTTYNVLSATSDFQNHLTHGVTDDSFWVWLMQNDANDQQLIEVRTSDGAILRNTRSYVFYPENFDETDPPGVRRFGSYSSCTLFQTQTPTVLPKLSMNSFDTIPPGDSTPQTVDNSTPCECCCPGEHTGTNPGPVIPPEQPHDWFAQCGSGGLAPDGNEPTNSEDYYVA